MAPRMLRLSPSPIWRHSRSGSRPHQCGAILAPDLALTNMATVVRRMSPSPTWRSTASDTCGVAVGITAKHLLNRIVGIELKAEVPLHMCIWTDVFSLSVEF
ncbi:hypothetical protein chiPu_0018031 [Chiloscyllium punctatum]|uniref:Uncharacterized protein n=1 Tax=Chiloscyllium punctatum TaxID=137246 RepID=A0A401RKM4_CHIPU|nr:hypothetical protein [Chiloscyllium punctatum]